MSSPRLLLALSLALLLPHQQALADSIAQLPVTIHPDTIVVSATRLEQSAVDLPVAIDSINQTQLRNGQLQVNLSESLARIPGIVAQNRQNYAQDLQISSRGFGARAIFGMRGPFSSLYGNSSGGVISLFTEDGAPGTTITPSVTFGSFGTQRIGTKISGDTGTLNYAADISSFRTVGYRDHSAAKRDTFNRKFKWKQDADSKLTLIFNAVDMPHADDPLGLTRVQFVTHPKQAGTNALAYNTRKSVAQQQLGLAYARKVGAGDTAHLFNGGRAQNPSATLSGENVA